MDNAIMNQLAKQADTGAATIILLLIVLCVLCWPRIVDGIARLRGKKSVTVEGDVHTEKKPTYVPVAECNRRMCEHAERMTRLEDEVKKSNATVIAKLDEIDSRAEERAQATHRRLDPIIGQVAANTEAIGNIKQLAFNATMGGNK